MTLRKSDEASRSARSTGPVGRTFLHSQVALKTKVVRIEISGKSFLSSNLKALAQFTFVLSDIGHVSRVTDLTRLDEMNLVP